MMLSYYRNSLVHLFMNEAEIMSSLYFSVTQKKQSASFDEIYEKTMFIKDLLSGEFVLKDTMRTKEDVTKVLKLMQERDFLKLDLLSGGIAIDPLQENQLIAQSFLCQLLFPYIDTYAITLAYFSIPTHLSQYHEEESLYQKIQWVIETLYQGGNLKFYESCMLESIRNAIKRFHQMGVLSKETIQIKRTLF